MRRSRQRLRVILLLGVGAALTGLWLLAYGAEFGRRYELFTVDQRFELRGNQAAPRDIVVVGVDDVTFDELGEQWPFPRRLHAKVVDRLAADGARVIAYDVQFTEPSREGPEDDFALFEAASRAEPTVFATTEVAAGGRTKVLGGDENLREIGARAAQALLPPDPDKGIRRVWPSFQGLESFASAVAEASSGRQVDPSGFGGTAWIDYHGEPGTIPTYPFSRVMRGRVPKGTFRNKIVVIGAVAPSLQDVKPTPTSGSGLMSGPEVQANAISTVRRGFPLDEAPGGLAAGLIALLGMVAPVASLRFSPIKALALAVVALAGYLVAAQLAFNGGTILPVLYPLGAIVLSAFGAMVVHYFTETRERRRMRLLFSRFVPESVVDEVLARTSDDDLRLGGVRLEGTVMFSDLRGFTSFAEKLPAEQVIEILNRYLSEMSDAILDHGGTLVAYMGDGIMAVFGAPIEQEDHADRGLAAAREMLGERLERFNAWLREEDLGEGFRMGVGLNSGPVMSGNVGSERRLEYTAIGDTTNTAARLEGMTKGTPHQLFMAESTRAILRTEATDLVFVDDFEVRGREARIKVWSTEAATDPTDPTDAATSASGAGPSG